MTYRSYINHAIIPAFKLSRDENLLIGGEAMSLKRLSAVFSILVCSIFLTACPSQTNVAKINADPARYSGKEVAIAGKVTDSYGFMGAGGYEIDDGTGKVWVATTRGVPSRGALVGAKGYVRSGVTFSGRTFGTVIEETDRHVKGK